MDVSRIPQLLRNTGRFSEVVGILARYGFVDWLSEVGSERLQALLRGGRSRELAGMSQAARVREALMELGPTYIKLGQILSTRPDLVGEELAHELGKLRTSTEPDPAGVVRATIEEELGGSVRELYAQFDDVPLGSASIGQVHRATLHDGTRVVVKVQHADIEDRVRNDLEILAHLAELAERHSTELRRYRPVATARDFRSTLLRELDFRQERRNLELFRRNFAGERGVRFPQPYAALCSRRVLTMDLLEGIELGDRRALRSAELDLEELARRGATLFMQMIFRDAFYHADPHPGNLLILPGARPQDRADGAAPGDASDDASQDPVHVIGVIDCGMVGRIDEQLRREISEALRAIVGREADTLARVIERIGSTPEDLDQDELRLDVANFIDEYADQSLSEFDLSGCLSGIIAIIRTHRILLPARIAMLLKVLIMLEGTAQRLNPSFSLAELIQPFARESIGITRSPRRILELLRGRIRDWDRLIEILPTDAADILHRLKSGRFDVHLRHRDLETIVNRLVVGILTAALFMGSASLWSLDVSPSLWGVSLPGALGCFLAVLLGVNLLRQIRRSRSD